MELEILGYIGAVLIGLSLGLIGAGGSILTVPVLVYLFMLDTVIATTYTLFIVGLTSMIGSLRYMKMSQVNFKTALIFGIPSIASVMLTRAFLLPAIPQILFSVGHLQITKSIGLLLFFAIIMLLASFSMILKPIGVHEVQDGKSHNSFLISIIGLCIGVITGLVGAGGGFLIIPALVMLAKLPMKKSIGTSLVIITMNSLTGFIGSLKHDEVIDWRFLIIFTAIAVTGIISGSALSKKIPGEKLKPAFGWFVLAMGIYIILKETVIKQ
jgi:uncharacterized protein